MSRRLAGRTAIITGGGYGVGLAVAERLAIDGCRVVITSRDKDELNRAVDHLGGAKYALGIAGQSEDVAHQDDVIQEALWAFGRVDFLVTTGSAVSDRPLVELDAALARQAIETNCITALSWIQRVYRAWMHEHGGAIVSVSPHSCPRSSLSQGILDSTDALLSSLTRVLAAELGPNARINGVAPTMADPSTARRHAPLREDSMAHADLTSRLGECGEIGNVVAFLLSSDAGWMTGQTVALDSGPHTVAVGA